MRQSGPLPQRLREQARSLEPGWRGAMVGFPPFFLAGHARRVGGAPAHRHGGGLGVGLLLLLAVLFVFPYAPQLLFLLLPILFFVLPAVLAGRWLRARASAAAEPGETDERWRTIEAEAVPDASGQEAASRAERLERACDRVLEALEQAPGQQRSFLTRPRETVEMLRRNARELAERERTLRALADEQDAERLQLERDRLRARIGRETDPVARERLESALVVLEDRRAEVQGLLRSAARLEAEQLRLEQVLEGLRARVLRLSAAGAGEPGGAAAVQESVRRLRDELAALADAYDEVEQAPAARGRERVGIGPHAP